MDGGLPLPLFVCQPGVVCPRTGETLFVTGGTREAGPATRQGEIIELRSTTELRGDGSTTNYHDIMISGNELGVSTITIR